MAKQIFTDPMNGMNPGAREIGRLEPQSRWDKEAANSVIGVLWRLTDGRSTVDRPQIRLDPTPVSPWHFKEHELRGKESQNKISTNSEPV